MDYVNKGLIMVSIILILLLTERFVNVPYINNKINQPIKSKFKNVISLFDWACMNYNEHSALLTKRKDNWQEISYQSYYYLVNYLASGLQLHGLTKGDRICFLGNNAPGWFITHLATIKAGGVSVGLYPLASIENLKEIMDDCQPKFLVVEDNEQLEKFIDYAPINKTFPYIDKIISYSEVIKPDLLEALNIPYVHINLLIKEGYEHGYFNDIQSKSNDVIALVYTSGTTGKSKGAMITNKNIISVVGGLIRKLNVNGNPNWLLSKKERILSYLPLNHIASQMTDIYLSLAIGGSVYFGDKEIFKTTMIKNLKEIRPTVFVSVPRVWEKLKENIEKESVDSNLYYFGKIMMPKLVGSNILSEIGLNKCKMAVTTSAPLEIGIKKFFIDFGLPLYEIYGMTETTGPMSIATPQDILNNTHGDTLASINIKINSNNENEGEILVKGDGLFKGYLNQKNHLNKNGWFFTGDIGKINTNNKLIITGRKKDLIITSGGENIAPIEIENVFRSSIPFINNVIIIGDKRKYIIALITLKNDFVNSKEYESMNDKEFNILIDEAVEKVNKKAKSRSHQIKKVRVLSNDFSYETGELTHTMKLKRKYIEQKYSDIINSMY